MSYLLIFICFNAFAECMDHPCIISSDENADMFFQLKDELYVESSDQNIVVSDINILNDANKFVDYAKSFLGTPYLYGGESKDGIDCSAFVREIFLEFGYYFPRTSRQQFRDERLKIVSVDDLRPLDLVFFKGDSRDEINHVALYIGDGKIIHSSKRENGVAVTDIKFSSFWSKRFYAAKRPTLNIN
jgi:cell wall-associated NlpC family hydrolase